MRKTVHQAARATVQLAMGAGLAFVTYIFTTVLLGTAIATIAVVGTWMLPETVLLVRQTAGTKRRMVARWTGREIPEAYQPIEGRLCERLRTAVRDPGTLTDLRWMVAYYGYGCLLSLALLPLWPVGLLVDGLRYPGRPSTPTEKCTASAAFGSRTPRSCPRPRCAAQQQLPS